MPLKFLDFPRKTCFFPLIFSPSPSCDFFSLTSGDQAIRLKNININKYYILLKFYSTIQ